MQIHHNTILHYLQKALKIEKLITSSVLPEELENIEPCGEDGPTDPVVPGLLKLVLKENVAAVGTDN